MNVVDEIKSLKTTARLPLFYVSSFNLIPTKCFFSSALFKLTFLIILIHVHRLIENEYLGLRNGILDQSAILLSAYGCLTYMDCKVMLTNCYILKGFSWFHYLCSCNSFVSSLSMACYSIKQVALISIKTCLSFSNYVSVHSYNVRHISEFMECVSLLCFLLI